ncbi:MAG: DUF3047 domain-containing protein, partial [Gammaproteobacteria bacterium]|nr:DUF3047 domain-containing protein [Gammaproteobacteria bacterium]
MGAAHLPLLIVGNLQQGLGAADIARHYLQKLISTLTFPKISKHTDYELVKDGDTHVVKAVSEAAASGLTRKIAIDLNKTPILRWRWKVDNVIQQSDVTRKEGDDYAARIYITFAYEPDKVSFGKKLKYNAGKLLFGSELPIGAINYIWESKTPKDTIVDNAYTDFVK